MHQPVPDVSSGDVERVVRRDFASSEASRVLEILSEYQSESGSPFRVRLAALKLAGGDLDRLRQQIEAAKYDYRDVLASAEYPAYFKKMFRIDKLPADEKQKIIDEDWRQYETWFKR